MLSPDHPRVKAAQTAAIEGYEEGEATAADWESRDDTPENADWITAYLDANPDTSADEAA